VGGTLIGLIADCARAIISADRRLIDPLPSLLAARTGGEAKIKAVFRGDSGRRLISILAPEQLFREDVMRRLDAMKRLAIPNASELDRGVRAESKFLLFRLGGDEFALPIDAVEEVVRVPDHIARVPKTPKFLEGVVNLRGDILPIVDQRRRFEMPKPPDAKNRRVIVVRTAGHRAGLIVDSVSEVLSRPADAVKAAPDWTDEIARLVRGVINLENEDRIVLLLDPSELLTPAERGLLDEFAPDLRPTGP
jgi:purine-binding chemotaxis protein CheW